MIDYVDYTSCPPTSAVPCTESNYALDTLTQIAVKGKADLFIVPLSAVDNSWC